MKSTLAAKAEEALLKRVQSLTQEERLNAFFMHSRLMTQLKQSGEKSRQEKSPRRKPCAWQKT